MVWTHSYQRSNIRCKTGRIMLQHGNRSRPTSRPLHRLRLGNYNKLTLQVKACQYCLKIGGALHPPFILSFIIVYLNFHNLRKVIQIRPGPNYVAPSWIGYPIHDTKVTLLPHGGTRTRKCCKLLVLKPYRAWLPIAYGLTLKMAVQRM